MYKKRYCESCGVPLNKKEERVCIDCIEALEFVPNVSNHGSAEKITRKTRRNNKHE